jgi:two-component system LytT family sensor kinase
MKRIAWHLLFWMAYLVQDVLLIFLVNVTKQLQPDYGNAWLSLANALVLLIPKLFFTYFIVNIVLRKVAGSSFNKKTFIYTAFALLFSILLYRLLMVYFVAPVIYQWDSGQSIFYPLGLLVALMDIGFVAGVAIVIKQINLQLAAKKREERLTREKLHSEIRFLRNQINPHFLFNTLNNIYALSRKKSDQAPEAILKLSKLLRFILYEASRPSIRIEEEIKILDDFIELEKIRYNSRLTINFYREIDNVNEPISPLLLLPFVENAFKHGASESHFDSYIHIDMVLANGLLTFKVENTTENHGKKGINESIGLQNVKRQLELIYSEYDFQVFHEPHLFKIALSINLKRNEKNQLSYIGG